MFLVPRSHWEVQTTKEKGKGVFAKKDLDAGLVIGDYLGTVIHPDKEKAYEKKHGFYSMYYHDNASIFPPNPKEDGVHLLNHSCAPNCWMYTYKGHTLFFTLRKIFKGEELTISYLLGPQDDDCKPCKDQCKCESFNCSYTMHMPEKQYNAWVSYDNKLEKETTMEPVVLNTKLKPLPDYPKTIRDASIYTLIGSSRKKPATYSDAKLPSVSEIRKRIRETGKYLEFEKLAIVVRGVVDDIVFAKPN